uniref:Uncharacterized protein n=1 Tax=Strigamia maritima TaxID=126957 RepID=T1IY53_STRMM
MKLRKFIKQNLYRQTLFPLTPVVAIDTWWQIVSREFCSRLLLIKYSSKVVLFLVEIYFRLGFHSIKSAVNSGYTGQDIAERHAGQDIAERHAGQDIAERHAGQDIAERHAGQDFDTGLSPKISL